MHPSAAPDAAPDAAENPPQWFMPVVCVAVFLACTPWFAGTAVAPQVARDWALGPAGQARLTSAVQIGFIVGTSSLAVLGLADRFSARWVFVGGASLAALANLAFALLAWELEGALVARFVTGVALAGVYPVGMKLVASWYRQGLGWRLGALVAALTLGTGAPYLLRHLGAELAWRTVAGVASGAALLGGLAVAVMVTDGPHLPGRAPFRPTALRDAFARPAFRGAALGYFGHMWELYALWSLVGLFVADAWPAGPATLVAFGVVAVGAGGALMGGWWSRRLGERRVAAAALGLGGLLGLVSPLLHVAPPAVLVGCLLLWGVVVIADSAQFSAIAAASCPPASTGSVLSMMNGIGYLISALSILAISLLAEAVGWRWALLGLVPGPALGLWAFRSSGRAQRNAPTSPAR